MKFPFSLVTSSKCSPGDFVCKRRPSLLCLLEGESYLEKATIRKENRLLSEGFSTCLLLVPIEPLPSDERSIDPVCTNFAPVSE
jgi:hypothetical protein